MAIDLRTILLNKKGNVLVAIVQDAQASNDNVRSR